MTADTILNITVVVLALAASVLAGVVVYFVHVNRQAILNVQVAVVALKQSSLSIAGDSQTLITLLRNTGDWVEQYKHVLSNNVDLNKQIEKLTRSNEVLHGQTVELTNMLQSVNGVVRAQWTALERRDRAIADLVPLVDQLTKALDEKPG